MSSYIDHFEGQAHGPQCWCLALLLTQKQYEEHPMTLGIFAGKNKMTQGMGGMVKLSSSSRRKFSSKAHLS